MLPLAYRLKRRSDFGRIYSKGRSCATDLVVVYVLPARGPDTKIGFSVSKKLGNAVVRNRVRRLLRESARPFLDRLRSGQNIIILARARAGRAQLADLTASLGSCFSKQGILDAGDL